MYSVFRDLLTLPRHWRCASEAHEAESKNKKGKSRWRLDLILLAEGAGSSGSNGVGFELKVDKISESEISEAVEDAMKYAKTFKINIYLVNFISRRSRPPKPDMIRRGSLRVFLVNVTYNDNLNEVQAKYVEETNGGNVENDFKVCLAGDIESGSNTVCGTGSSYGV